MQSCVNMQAIPITTRLSGMLKEIPLAVSDEAHRAHGRHETKEALEVKMSFFY